MSDVTPQDLERRLKLKKQLLDEPETFLPNPPSSRLIIDVEFISDTRYNDLVRHVQTLLEYSADSYTLTDGEGRVLTSSH